MPANGGITLFNSSLTGAGSSATFSYVGGQSVIVAAATGFGVVTLQAVEVGVAKLTINCCSSFVSNAIIPFNAPAGRYAMSQASGTSVSLFIALIPAG